MKHIKYLILPALFLTASLLLAKDKMSPFTQHYLLKQSFVKSSQNLALSKQKLSGMIKVSDNFNAMELNKLGVRVRTKAGNIWTVSLPASAIDDLSKLDGIEYIQLDEPISFHLDSARKHTGADIVQRGFEHGVFGITGNGVVVGVVDAGFDYTQPVFFDSTNQQLRIKRVWEQKKEGQAPLGYDYGNELKSPEEIWAAKNDLATFSHGTHVAGIAAGNGNASDGKFTGIAPKADLVFVGIRPEPSEWKSTGMSSLVDAFNYIFEYADSQGKPAVANLSWGIAIGPRDGNSLFNQACNNMIKPGRAISISAGNSGQENLHISHNFTEQDSTFSTAINFNTYFPRKYTWLDCWGSQGASFEISLQLYSIGKKQISSNSLVLSTDTSSSGHFKIINDKGDSCNVNYVVNHEDFNGKPHILFEIESFASDRVLIRANAQSGTLHYWAGMVEQYSGYASNFTSLTESWAKTGDKQYVVNDLSVADSVFSVAAYSTKNKWDKADGGTYNSTDLTGKLASFSSNGPALSVMNKPDLAAPGYFVVSAVGSADPDYATNGSSRNSVVQEFVENNTTHKFAALAGTSMASPVVAGAIALMFEANPNISTREIRNVFERTSLKNEYYTSPDLWGFGCLRVDLAINDILGITSIIEGNQANSDLQVIASQNTLKIELKNQSSKDFDVQIYDLNGRLHYSDKLPANQNEMILNKTLPNNAIYIIRLSNNTENYLSKFITN